MPAAPVTLKFTEDLLETDMPAILQLEGLDPDDAQDYETDEPEDEGEIETPNSVHRIISKGNVPLDAFEKAVKDNEKMLAFFTRSFQIQGYSYEERYNFVLICFAKAVAKYISDRGPFEPFARMVIRNGLRTLYARERKHHSLYTTTLDADMSGGDDDTTNTAKDLVPDTEPGPAEVTSNQEISTLLRSLVPKLPELERKIVSMKFGLEGGRDMTIREIVAALGIPITSVHRQLQYGMAKLRAELQKVGIDVHTMGEAEELLGTYDPAATLLEALEKIPVRLLKNALHRASK